MFNDLLKAALGMMVAGSAFAATQQPLIVKTNHPGFVHPDWYRSEKCEIYRDRLVITRQFGSGDNGFSTTEVKDITVAGAVQIAIERAASADLQEKDNGLCDGPSTYILANKVAADDSVESVVLFSTGGCGSPRLKRDGADADNLQQMMLNYCPTVHDFAGQ